MTAQSFTMKTMRALCFAAGAACALATAAGAEDNNQVDVHLKGSVRATCNVAGNRSVATPVSVGNVNESGSTFVEYPINCNAPFKYKIISDNGGLRRSWAIGGNKPMRLYDVNVNIPTDSGVAINDTCSSDDIERGNYACDLSDSGSDVALDQTARITVSWGGGDDVPGGTYSDRLTFTVEPQS